MELYQRKSEFVNINDLTSDQKTIVENHNDQNGLGIKFDDQLTMIKTISTTQKKKLFKTVDLIEQTYTFFSDDVFLNLIIDTKGQTRIISVRLKDIINPKEFQPVKIGKNTIEDSGFEIQGVFYGLGMTSAKSQVSSYFIGIEKGACYEKARTILIR